MHILLVTASLASDMVERWAKLGIVTTVMRQTELIAMLGRLEDRQHISTDVVVFMADLVVTAQMIHAAPEDATIMSSAAVIRELPEQVAMPDGRCWRAIPIVLAVRDNPYLNLTAMEVAFNSPGAENMILLDQTVSPDNDFAANTLKEIVQTYRQDVLRELDNLGFIVAYEAGRYRLGPALRPRPTLAGHYYFGPADRRSNDFVTIDRDLIGIQLEVELFEALLNNAAASESQFQAFFEQYPHFLSVFAVPLPHIQLRDVAGRLLVPDFILKPVVAARRDSRWEVLDLKRPQTPLLAGKASRRRLSHEVQEAVRQLRDYGDYFADPRNGTAVERALGQALRRPKLGVLIGRIASVDVEPLELEQSRLPDVRIVTYDEILEQQKSLLS